MTTAVRAIEFVTFFVTAALVAPAAERLNPVVPGNLKRVREGLKSVMRIPWSIISAPAAAKAKSEEGVFAK